MPSIALSLIVAAPLILSLTPLLAHPVLLNGREAGSSELGGTARQGSLSETSVDNGLNVDGGNLNEVAQIFPDITNPDVQFLLQGEALLNLGFLEDGIALFEAEIRRLQEQGEVDREAGVLVALASTLELKGELEQAAPYYQRALTIYNDSLNGDRPINSYDSLETARTLGRVYLGLGQPEQALMAYEQGLAIARATEDPWGEANLLGDMGLAYQSLGQTEDALSTYAQALSNFRALGGDPYEAPRILNRVGLIYLEQGQYETAHEAFQQSSDAVTNPEDFGQVANLVLTLENFSRLHTVQGQTELAGAYAQQAEVVLRTLPRTDYPSPAIDILRQTRILEEMGGFYLDTRDLERAGAYFERAVAIAQQSPDSYAAITLLGSIALTHGRNGLLAEAIPYQEQTVALFRTMGLGENAATALKTLARLYQRLGQWEPALANYEQALTAYEGMQQEYGSQAIDLAQVFQGMGEVYAAQEQFEAASTAYQQALDHYQEAAFPYGQVFVLERLADLHRMYGETDRAEAYAQEAQTLRAAIGSGL